MKKSIIITFSFLAVFITSCQKETYFGSDELAFETRNVSSFTKISSEGVFDVKVYKGTSQLVEIRANHNVLRNVKTVVINNELRLYLKDGNYKNVTLEAVIYVPEIDAIRNSGAGNFFVEELNNLKTLNIYNLGIGNISINGFAKIFKFKNEGSGNLYGEQFKVDECEIDILGSGNCEISCNEKLNVAIEGSGNVYYTGNPMINSNIKGTGSVINRN